MSIERLLETLVGYSNLYILTGAPEHYAKVAEAKAEILRLSKPHCETTSMSANAKVKDRKNWSKSQEAREGLIKKAAGLGLLLNQPRQMKLSELERLVDKAENWSVKARQGVL